MRPFETAAVGEATGSTLRVVLAHCWMRVRRWHKARQTYRALCRLDDRALKDIGFRRPDLAGDITL